MTLRAESQERGDIVVVDGHEKPLVVRRLALVIGAEERENHLQVMLNVRHFLSLFLHLSLSCIYT